MINTLTDQTHDHKQPTRSAVRGMLFFIKKINILKEKFGIFRLEKLELKI